MNKCKTCGKNCDGEYCFQHKPKKGFNPTKKESSVQKVSEMQEFFLKIWKKRLHYSEVSTVYLGDKPLSVFFHHILPKNKYPEAALDDENIILLTLNEHDQVESDMYRYQEVNIRRELLKQKYDK